MATRIRTLDFLPEIFKTTTNAQFLAATLDQLVAQPNTRKIQGYIGSKFGYGVNATDYYVTEPTKTRTDYQLDPGVIFLKENTSTAKDFISYPGIVDALALEGGITNNNNRLFNSEFYSWDSFTNLDPIINFNQYYWLPEGPERVTITTDIVYNSDNFNVQAAPDFYLISSDTNTTPTSNPTLTLLRGGTYTFNVNQATDFWIQGEPGVTGYSKTQPNTQTRDVYGVTNNGASNGTITFYVPQKNALADYTYPGNNTVNVVSTLPFSQVNGAFVRDIGGIDGITALNGLTVMFYNTGEPDEIGYVNQFYDQTTYDTNGGVPYNENINYPGSPTFNYNFEGGYYSTISANFFTITLLGELDNPFIQLTPTSAIPSEQNITVTQGTQWVNKNFFRSTTGVITAVPYNSAILNTLYYQDGTIPGRVGVINIIENNITNQIDVLTQILGKKQYTAPNGVVFTNGLKVLFQGNIYPASYNNVEYYVEGVGTAIELIPVSTLISPGLFSQAAYIPYDTTPYDVGNFDSSLYVPIDPDYITIARNSINRNPWSRSNRWFHIDVINASAAYNNNPALITEYTQLQNKAKRPIIEFYPNLKLFDSGVVGKNPIDFIDTKTTDAFTFVAGQPNYYPDTAGYTTYTSTIAPVTGPNTSITATQTLALVNQVVLSSTTGLYVNDTITFGSSFGGITSGTKYYITDISGNNITISTSKQGVALTLTSASASVTTSIYPYSTTITALTTDVFGLFKVGQYITDSTELLPSITFITNVEIVGNNTVITVSWYDQSIINATSVASVVTADTPLDNYALFDGARVVFTADTDINVKNKIYVSRFSTITPGSTPVITLTEAEDGLVLPNEQTVVFRGYYYQGQDFYFTGENWNPGQQKTQLNQSPKFDVYDSNGISFGDKFVYVGTSFVGSTLFSYGIGTGGNDTVLGFPLRYSSVDNVGDISFDVTLNSDTFTYVNGTTSKTEKVNTGYVYNYTLPTPSTPTVVRQLGWQTAVSPSVQYQIFEFNYDVIVNQTNTFVCDIAPVLSISTNWPLIQVYINNVYLPNKYWTATTTDTTTSINITTIAEPQTVVQILILSDQVSATAYYQTPINLNNNPFNGDLTTANIGEIRGQYQSIFYNNPNTTGEVFGPNNYRDLGNLVPWGNRIIQNSASLVMPGTILRNQAHNIFNSLLFNSRQYITFKTLLVDTVNNADYSIRLTPSQMLDDALDKMNASHTDDQPFFWSDMIPSKAPYISNTYSFANTLDVSVYPLSHIYNFSTANYNSVLVYLTRNGVQTQLVKGVDYTVSTDSPSLTVTKDLQANDQITINEYNQTYGSYAPNTPTKLGLYPATIPAVVLDTAYNPETYFIVGHDGSFNKLYGTYNTITGTLVDFRDQVLLEYETRVYNNLKLSETAPAGSYQGVIIPGFFRQTDYTYDEFLQIYSESFLNWVGQNRIDYKTQFYNKTKQFTYNYRDSGNKLNNQPIEQGYFRGAYLYFYDTSTPNETPWEMLGLANEPTWWTTRYGAAPYTSDNLVLWGDLETGTVWNNGNPYIKPNYARPGLLDIIPVNSNGELLSPFDAIVGNYTEQTFNKDWQVGDVGPAEFSYRRSSTWPFDLMRILALTKPADFFNLGVDVDNYKFNTEFNQYLVNDRSHLVLTNIPIYGQGTPATSYLNWIVDYEKQVGVNATLNLTTLLDNLDVRLVYRMAGFSDKNLLKFYVEKSSANSNNSSLLIPDESYGLILYENQPFDRIVYSGIVVQISENGYKVYGNSQTNAYFKVLTPKAGTFTETITVENLTVKISNEYYDKVQTIPYGTEFYNAQQVAQFIMSYGAYLTSQGVLHEIVESGIPINWQQMVAEYLYWAQTGWELGSITTINPSAGSLTINKDSRIVQPLTLRQTNFVLNQDLYPIPSDQLSVVRDGTSFVAVPLNRGDAISYGQFNISNIENSIIFDNVTLFNDIIYNLITGLRQNRITVNGAKTADWTGILDAYGFILNQDNVVEWTKEIKYTKGSIVKYKNKYWSAITIVQAKEVFDEREWKETPYSEIQKGLLPNSQTRSYESTLYYDVDKANLENDADLLSFSLIGYRPRDYLALVDLTDITQVNVYKNLIKDKGTKNAASAFKGANLPQGGIDYELYENWAIKSGEFGGTLNNNFIEFRLSQPDLTGNPSIVGLTNGTYTNGVQQEVPLYSVFNYGTPISSPDILPTISSSQPSSLYPTAGYVNFDDVKMASYFYSGLSNAQNAAGTVVPINEFYVRDYVWLANYLADWQVYTPASLGSIINAKNNLNNTVTITFSQAHNLTKYQVFAIVNFNVNIDNYYIVSAIVDPFNVIINLALNPQITNINGLGIGFRMQSQRVATAPEIVNLPLLDNEFNKVKVWVDTNNDGSWAVFRKSINYQYNKEIVKPASDTFGSAVAYTNNLGYLISDSAAGEVYRYAYNATIDAYSPQQTITQATTFGANISYVDNLFVISQPTTTPTVYIYQLINTRELNTLALYQTIAAPGGVTTWGTSTALSGDQNWLYVSDIDNNSVYAYRKANYNITAGSFVSGKTYTIVSVGTTDFTLIGATSNNVGTAFIATGAGAGTGVAEDTTYAFSYIIDGDALGLTVPGDQFGYSVSTDYYGDTVVIGTPQKDYDLNTANYGYTYVFSRTVQNFESQSTSQAYIPLTFPLAWSPVTVTQTATDTNASNDRITISDSTVFSVGDPVVFSGSIISAGAISQNTVYYVQSKPTSTTFTISSTRYGSVIQLGNDTGGTMTVTVQTTPLTVTINGTVLTDNYYSVIGSTLSIYSNDTPTLNAGDILNVGGSNFVLAQTLTNEETPRVGVQFGLSTDTNRFANEILIGAPFELSDQNYEGAVHRYTNGGEKYGIIFGNDACNITTPRTILLNGYKAILPVGNAATVAASINLLALTNIYASATDQGKLAISLINNELGIAGNKLTLTILDTATLGEMGMKLYTQTQKITCPHVQGRTQFGTVVKFDKSNSGSFIASAPVGTRYSATTFDFTDDELDNDTVFDNNATQWVDTFRNAGAVYMFDYLSTYNENLNAPGKFVYAQSTNARDLDYGSQPYYGGALDFNSNRVTVGTPNFMPTTNANDTNGQVVTYISTSSSPDWAVFRSSAPVVDINGVFNIQLFSAMTNQTIENLDYIDPLQGKLLGAVVENIDIVANTDPARYTTTNNAQGGLVWGADKIGQLWFDTTNVRFMNYHQNDVSYNSRWWGRVFPGSDVAVYSWIGSNVTPSQYTGPGTPYDINTYSIRGIINQEGLITPVYYFWVRNSNIVFSELGKTLADSTLQSYIAFPSATGIGYFTPLLPNVFALYNCFDYINAKDTVLHIGYSITVSDDVAHNQYSLIRANYPDDFLSGVPGSGAGYQNHAAVGITEPIGLYNRMLDSMSGVDNAGGVVPDPLLPKAVQTGILARPRQGFFYNRFGALKNYLIYANTVLAQFPIIEIRNSQFLYQSGEFFDTRNYWNTINWWAPGYNNNTKSALQVPLYADLSTLSVAVGTIVTVAANSAGNSETYIYSGAGVWTRIGLANGTIEFSSKLWDYAEAKLGFGDNFFDTTPYDEYPSTETRYIIRALNEEIYTNELLVFRNKSLILLFEYIQSETIESQNYLDWLNKTSFIDVSHTIRELLPLEVFRSDNQLFLEGYLNEVKPYHVVIKEFIFKYTRTEIFEGDITDFDLPAQYNSSIEQFVTPELVYSNPSLDTQYLYTDAIWQTAPYSQWYNNYGLSITGQEGYQISVLASYLSLNSNSCFIDNVNGLPVTGTIMIGEEQIGYANRNLATNELTGLSRGANGTTITIHIPGEDIFIDLPPVVVLNEGRGYANPPRVTAYIDTTIYPAPRVPAQFEPIMSLGYVVGINLINPGEGYAVLPTINIDPAFTLNISSTNVDIVSDTIDLTGSAELLQTGDLVVYSIGADSTAIGGLIVGQRYYVNLLEISPSPVFALYSTYLDAINNANRVVFESQGSGTQYFSVGAVASCVTSAIPVRENSISLRFDRTSYNSQVIDWLPGNFYGSFYAGSLNNSNQISSSSITLESTSPPINSILASAHGAVFEILDSQNQQSLTWSSRTRNTVQTYGSAYSVAAYRNAIRINPNAGGAEVAGSIGSTTGFYIGMPVKFIGSTTGTPLVSSTPPEASPQSETIYYVKSLVQLPNATVTLSANLKLGHNYVIGSLGTTNWNTVAGTTGVTYSVGNVIIIKATAIGTGTAYLLEDTGFTISASVDGNGNPGAVVAQNTTNISAAGLTLYVGQLTNLAVLTINYDGIRTVTATTATTNYITTPLTVTGQNGTSGFYLGLPIFFTGDVFGGVVENEIYYVITVVDNQTFTASTNNSPTNFTVTATTSGTNYITCSSTTNLTVNEPIIFTGTTFGNIVAGTTYYVRAIISNTSFTIADGINGNIVTLTTDSGSCTCTSQADTVVLTTVSNKSMTLNVGLPISPGQITGQEFTLYQTSDQYVNKTGTVSNLLTREISATLATVNRICLTAGGAGLTNIYNNLEFNIASSIGGLTVGAGPYTVNGFGTTTITVTNTSSTGYWLTLPIASNANTTNVLYVGMPLYFSGTSLGGVAIGVVYYVYSIDSSPPAGTGRFTISTDINLSSVYQVTTDNGTMTGTGDNYLTISGGYSLKNSAQTVTISNASPAVFTVTTGSAFVNGASVVLHTTGTLPAPLNDFTTYYVINLSGNTFNLAYTTTGSAIGTTTAGTGVHTVEQNPVQLTQAVLTNAVFDVNYKLGGYSTIITTAGSGYAINNIVTITGDLLGGTKPANNLQLTVLTVNSTGGITSGIANGTPAGDVSQYYLKVISENQVGVYSNPNCTVPVSGENFAYQGATTTAATATSSLTDQVTVTSSASFNINDTVVFTGSVFGNIVLGQTYYILTKPTTTTVTISETLGGSTFQLATTVGTGMTMAKSGDYAFLPEPFFFNASIVKYNNRLYQCIVSNNDPEFIFGKWELLSSGSKKLNALDRIIGYYQPTVNMPGVDLTQLVSGITYPNSTYEGNAFAPAEQYTLDTILTDKPFYPAGINLKAIVWNGLFYLAGSDTNNNSLFNISSNGLDWAINNLANQTLNITDLIYAGGNYVITTNNNATPILISTNGYEWITNGTFTPYDSTPFNDTNFDVSSISVPATALNSVTYNNGIYVAVGNDIVTSTDLYTWTMRYAFTNGLTNIFNGVAHVSTAGYTGFVAVGLGQQLVSGIATNYAIIYTSTDSLTWRQVSFSATHSGFNSVASSTQSIVAVGDNGSIYTSFNTIVWNAQSSGVVTKLTNVIWDSYNNIYIAVGENGVILTAPIYGSPWTQRTSGTTETLESTVWNNVAGKYVIVGDKNTVLISSNAVTWTSNSSFISDPAAYTVEGDAFTAGYGPEELVPGVVSDTIMMTVATRPGTDWDETIYQHVGYNVVSTEIQPTSGNQTVYSFDNLVMTPAQLSVYIISYTNGLATRIYNGTNYTVNWINNTITLVTPLNYIVPGTDTLKIDVYEVGNGDQLVKANTKTDPIRNNDVTGFQEIYVNANYSQTVYQGSGVIRPGTDPVYVYAVATNGTNNTITCESVNQFILNSPITFSGAVFGGIVEDQVYYVKSIGGYSNRITISATYNSSTGTAGETVVLTTATGQMEAVIRVGTGVVWTPPSVYHNGTTMVLGTTAPVVRTKASNNAVTTISTGGLIVNQPIVFSDTMFGGVIIPHQVYYVKSIYDGNEFTISQTAGGTTLTLTNATGGAIFVTNDYAIGLADNGISASIILASVYDNTIDYITYTLMGETLPIQYGYTLPQTQQFVGDGSSASFSLTNYIGTTNATNAVVEVDGLRLNQGKYSINPNTNSILFTPPPSNGSTVAVTSYNLPERQYFNTQYNITGSKTLSTITVTSTTNFVVSFDYAILAGSFVVGQLYTIQSLNDNAYPTPGANTDFTAIGATSNTIGLTFTATGVGTGTGSAIIAGEGFDAINQTGLQTAGSFVLGNVYSIVTLGTTTNTQWNTIAGTTGITYAVGSIFTCANVGTGLGNGSAYSYSAGPFDEELNYLTTSSTSGLTIGYPVVFNSPAIGGIIAGQTYFVTAILNSTDFQISTQLGGSPIVVTSASGTMTGVINGITVSNITAINNTITPPAATVTVTATTAITNYITCNSTSLLVAGQPIIFKAGIVNAGSFVVGAQYQITTVGTTDFTLIGASSNTVGVIFTATGIGSGTGDALFANDGGIDTTGQVYFVGTIVSSTQFTIVDQFNNVITLTTSSSVVVGYMGGTPAIRVTTGINNYFTQNELVRLDGIVGATQLNNNVYYVHVITNKVFDLYLQPYNPALTAVNYPVTYSSTYISGGYAWIDQLFTIADTTVTSTTANGNRITVPSTTTLVEGTPVIFTEIGALAGQNLLGGILAKTTYYILQVRPEIEAGSFISGNTYEISILGTTNWNTIGYVGTPVIGGTFTCNSSGQTGTGLAFGLQEFTISANRYPNEAEVLLTNATTTSGITINVSQFEQVNVDRLWVTVNGYRVPSSSLKLNAYNNLSILTVVQTGDEVIVTSMMPTATPNEEVYLLNVTTSNQPSVYRANTQTRTWLTQPLYYTDSTIYVNDVTRITDNVVQVVTCPAAVSGLYNIGLTSNKNVICHITVYNNTTSTTVDPANYQIVIVDSAPVLQISAQVSAGNSLTVTSVEGRLLYINGEQIGFGECDLVANTVSQLTRGANGTGAQNYIPLYSEIFGLIPNNRMSDVLYSSEWNSYVYNTTDGDPLQISVTDGANFLRTDRN
jgi:hypothetical protein